eukprot:6178314-Pleurochrysis_carterae.AAC.2
MWMGKKDEHKSKVQRRWNICIMSKAFKKWKFMTGDSKEDREGNKEPEERKERTYGIKHWGRSRAIPRIHIKVE